jgi:DNA-binding YbaB/EbfC family protein
MANMNAMMQQAQAMQAKLQAAQAQFAEQVIEGAAGSGLVKVQLTGGGELKSVAIDPGLMEAGEQEMLGDLIVAAHADAKRRIDEAQQALMRQTLGPLAGALPPGLKF